MFVEQFEDLEEVQLLNLMEQSFLNKQKICKHKQQFISHIKSIKDEYQSRLSLVFDNLNKIEDWYLLEENNIRDVQQAIKLNKEEIKNYQQKIKQQKSEVQALKEYQQTIAGETESYENKVNQLESEI